MRDKDKEIVKLKSDISNFKKVEATSVITKIENKETDSTTKAA
jgi:hypothetical protein